MVMRWGWVEDRTGPGLAERARAPDVAVPARFRHSFPPLVHARPSARPSARPTVRPAARPTASTHPPTYIPTQLHPPHTAENCAVPCNGLAALQCVVLPLTAVTLLTRPVFHSSGRPSPVSARVYAEPPSFARAGRPLVRTVPTTCPRQCVLKYADTACSASHATCKVHHRGHATKHDDMRRDALAQHGSYVWTTATPPYMGPDVGWRLGWVKPA